MSGSSKKLIRNSAAEFLIFTSQTGEQNIEARYEAESILSAVTSWRRK